MQQNGPPDKRRSLIREVTITPRLLQPSQQGSSSNSNSSTHSTLTPTQFAPVTITAVRRSVAPIAAESLLSQPELLARRPVKIVFKHVAAPLTVNGAAAAAAATNAADPQPETIVISSSSSSSAAESSPPAATSSNAPPSASSPSVAIATIRTPTGYVRLPASAASAAAAPSPPVASPEELRDLFAALLKVKDPKLVARVMAAINNHNVNHRFLRCAGCQAKKAMRSCATQTWQMVRVPQAPAEAKPAASTAAVTIGQRKRRRREPHAVRSSDEERPVPEKQAVRRADALYTVDDAQLAAGSKSGGRVRVTAIKKLVTPERMRVAATAAEEEAEEQQQQQQSPASANQSASTPAPASASASPTTCAHRDPDPQQLLPSTSSATSRAARPSPLYLPLEEIFPSLFTGELSPDVPGLRELSAKLDRSNANNAAERMQRKIREEFRTLLTWDADSGLLPIHVAALGGDLKRVMRHVKILQYLQIPLSDVRLVAQDVDEAGELLGNSILHLAVDSLHPEALPIVQHLLAVAGASPMARNQHDDTVLHHAARNCDNILVFGALLTHLEDNGNAAAYFASLAATNQEGLAVLHILVNHRKLAFLELLLASVDRVVAGGKAPPISTPTALADLHRHLDRFDQQPVAEYRPRISAAKSALLDQPEQRTGRTALLRAVLQPSGGGQRMAMLLLAHHADPRRPDLAGLDCCAACFGAAAEAAGEAAEATDADAQRDGERQLQLQVGAYVQKATNVWERLEGNRTRAIRGSMRAASEQNQQRQHWRLVTAEAVADGGVAVAEARQPRRVYLKKRRAEEVERWKSGTDDGD